MSEETKTACEAPVLPSSARLEERVNQRVAHYLKTLTVDDLKEVQPVLEASLQDRGRFQSRAQQAQRLPHACMGKEGGVQRTYRYARGKDFGRMFCSEGLQNVWRAFRGALCKGLMTDIDMKNCHPVILLWLCEKFEIDCPKLREYVTAREHHLTELGKVLEGKDREHCKRLFLIATNTNQKIKNVTYDILQRVPGRDPGGHPARADGDRRARGALQVARRAGRGAAGGRRAGGQRGGLLPQPRALLLREYVSPDGASPTSKARGSRSRC